MNASSLSPLAFAKVLRNRWSLVADLTRRDALGRYRNSWLGILWSLVTPVLMLVVYTFVFSSIFKVRWTGGSGSKTEFAQILFSGLIVFNLFAECALKAPALIVGNANLVKRVVFPLEVLPVVALLSSLIHAAIAFGVLLLFQLFFEGRVAGAAALLPVLLLPHCLFVLGITWLLSSIAVYVRDIGQTVSVIVTVFMFLSPIFFPSSALPEDWRALVTFNPLAAPVEQVRALLMWGVVPAADDYIRQLATSGLVAWLGLAWFQHVRRGFADVL